MILSLPRLYFSFGIHAMYGALENEISVKYPECQAQRQEKKF